MAKKKKDAPVDVGVSDVVKQEKTPAEVFAFPRRLKVVSREKGERLMQELLDLGFKIQTRGNSELTQVTVTQSHRYVIDLTK